MQNIIHSIKKIPNYISVFGFFNGIKLFFKVEKPVAHNSNHYITVKPPGFNRPINLRSTIPDRSAFWICLVAE